MKLYYDGLIKSRHPGENRGPVGAHLCVRSCFGQTRRSAPTLDTGFRRYDDFVGCSFFYEGINYGVKSKSARRYLAIALFAATFLLAGQVTISFAGPPDNDRYRDALVKIYTVKNAQDYYNPWKMLNAEILTGSGCIIKNNRILTNAHVVSDSAMIQVRRNGQWKKVKAKIISISHEADLALLTTDEPEFFAKVEPLSFGELPKSQQDVFVYGFPFGGDSLSVTRGVLSRVEHQNYVHSDCYLLAGLIDAAINPGNSGGPVLVNNSIVGVVMQTADPGRSENMGYMIPMSVINHFLTDIADGVYNGFPSLGLIVQKMENPGIKNFYRMTEQQSGILVNYVIMGSPAEGRILKGDIILSIDGHAIADDATVEFRPRERTSFTYYSDNHQCGDNITMTILRKGVTVPTSLVLKKTYKDFQLVMPTSYDQKPSYIIYGGLVFSPLTKNLIKRWGSGWERSAYFEWLAELRKWITAERHEAVVVAQVLSADVNKGYDAAAGCVIETVDGKPIFDFNDFAAKIAHAEGSHLVFETTVKPYSIVLDRKQVAESKDEILRTYHVPSDRSDDVPKE